MRSRPHTPGMRPSRVASLRMFLSRDFLRYLGPGFVVAAGLIDPGNWATNVAAGSRFSYRLLWVITLGTLMLVLFQSLAARLGIVTGHSLAYNVRRRFSRPWAGVFGGSIVLACVATDAAELLGAALGFRILFGLPLAAGAVIAVVLKIALILTGHYRHLERVLVIFITAIAACYVVELGLVKPDWLSAVHHAFVPHLSQGSVLIAIGMLGAVVMPHNLYLHSNVVLKRETPGDDQARHRLLAYEFADTSLAMTIGWLVNCAMVVVAAAVFFRHGLVVTDLGEAAATLEPLAGNLARLLFGVGLLLAGLGSSFATAMAEVNILCAYLGRPEDPRSRFYQASLFALSLPALAIVVVGLDALKVLIISQVVLSVQLPLTIGPLIKLVSDRGVMGAFVSRRWVTILAIAAGLVIVFLDVVLLYDLAGGPF
jgi:manganese transport protein